LGGRGASKIWFTTFKTVSKLELKKWEQLLAELDIDLQCFWEPELIYPGKVSTLDDEDLAAFAQSNEINDLALQFSRINQADLELFESEAGHKLPSEYKKYLEVFGAGGFGLDGFRIDCPNVYNIDAFLGGNVSILESCLETFKIDKKWTSKLQGLLENSYIFGDGSNKVEFVFDLRTWSNIDQSYDIYGLNFSTCCFFQIGRDFFEFVRDCCIGEKIRREFPDLIYLGEREDDSELHSRSNVFIPFSRKASGL
jgi:hypothetical protein